jgi:tRNA (mo5U34)-methyltransferase
MTVRLREILERVLPAASCPPAEMDIRDIARAAGRFRSVIEKVKAGIGPVDFPWYPYDSLSNFELLDRALAGDRRRLISLAGGRPVLDIGPGDGLCSFFLESLGLKVHVVENPVTSHNGLRGIRKLKEELGSSVEIFTADLDEYAVYPPGRYGLVFLCGVLYHLKNPIHVLETLAARADYCVLSTRVARVSPDHATRLDHLPVGYLLGEAETNNDKTNYWIFSEAGLKRLLERSGWELLGYTTVGDTQDSDPVRSDRDERAFCLLRSHLSGLHLGIEFLDGWHALENGAWRWTARRFSVVVRGAFAGAETLKFRFNLPEALLAPAGPVTLAATANGVALGSESYDAAGEQAYVRRLPEEALRGGEVRVDFELDRALTGSGEDGRELGVLASGLEPPLSIR